MVVSQCKVTCAYGMGMTVKVESACGESQCEVVSKKVAALLQERSPSGRTVPFCSLGRGFKP